MTGMLSLSITYSLRYWLLADERRVINDSTPENIEVKLWMSAERPIFCELFWSLKVIWAMEQSALIPLKADEALEMYICDTSLRVFKRVKLGDETTPVKVEAMSLPSFNLALYFSNPSQSQCEAPCRKELCSPSSLHSVILRLSIIEGIRYAAIEVKASSATASSVKKAESGEEQPSCFNFSNCSFWLNLRSPMRASITNSTTDTPERTTVIIMQKLRPRAMISSTCESSPVARQCWKACYSWLSARMRKLLN